MSEVRAGALPPGRRSGDAGKSPHGQGRWPAKGGAERPALVQFGAGNIGRSFVGQLFARAGWEVIFVDVNPRIVEALNRERRYRVVIKRNALPDETILIEGVRAIDGRNTAEVAGAIAGASLLATSVGKNALPAVFPVIAEGLSARLRARAAEPLDIVIAENIRGAAAIFREELTRLLPSDYPFERLVGLVETSIGKMVPIMTAEDLAIDPLWVFAEEYNTLILDRAAFRGEIPDVAGLHPVANIAAYVDRKLFVHNLGHAATAYLGFAFDRRFTYIWEPLEAEELCARVALAMRQAAVALSREYPADLSMPDLDAHIADLLFRFRNRALGDTIYRVGRDLYRKLDREDRLVGAMLLAARHGLPFDAIASALRAATDFRATDESGSLFPADRDFAEREASRGIPAVLRDVCRLDAANPLDVRIIEAVLKG